MSLKAHVLLAAAVLGGTVWGVGASPVYEPSNLSPPRPAREFRGVWVATVANIDWPSKPGLSVAQQKAELISILDRAAELKLNAVVFQVRPACDALYASAIEPWSEYLTGIMGRAPQPFYDPLAFAIAEAHRRGLELHAWFNPFRARSFQTASPRVAPNHVSRRHPEFVRRYGKQLWLDPGDPAARQYSLSVVMDVVKRYDIDGVQFDDYFYPYQEKDAAGRDVDFPDGPTWKKFGKASGLSRADWRRQNINEFIESVYRSIKALKPWVKFGISPFGIWRPGNPPQIRGYDPYARLFADSRKWLADGWLDYFSPQLYWPIGQREQSFSALLDWWLEQNRKGRHIWPGLNVVKTTGAGHWGPQEIPNQIRYLRRRESDSGEIYWNASSLFSNASLDGILRRELNRQPALVPASPWLGGGDPAAPKASVRAEGGKVRFTWAAQGTDPVRWWVLEARVFSDWKTEILPPESLSRTFSTSPEAVAISAVDRVGNASKPVVFELRKSAGKIQAGLKERRR